MKKYLIIAFLLVVPSFSYAEVPSGVMGFMDGKLYNTSTNSLAYICFMDGNCYDKEMKFAFNRGSVAGTSTPTPTPSDYTLLTIPNQWFPRTLDEKPLPTSANTVQCFAYTNSSVELKCSNGSTNQVTVKSILYNSIQTRFEGDYKSVNDKLVIYDNIGNIVNYNSSSINTKFYNNGLVAKSEYVVFVPIPRQDPLKSVESKLIVKSYGVYPYLVLIEVEGKDVIYKVQ